MPRDDLNDPIGYDAGDARGDHANDVSKKSSLETLGGFRNLPWRIIALCSVGALVVGLVSFLVATDDGLGGEPYAVARLQRPAPAALPVPKRPSANNPDTTGSIGVTDLSGDEDEMQSGVRVLRPTSNAAPGSTTVLSNGAIILKVPDSAKTITPEAPAEPDRRLTEKSRYGLLPRIAADGARPADVYAGKLPSSARLSRNLPKIAIVIGGMGISELATEVALSKLPAEVTLGFAPFGSDLETQVARARSLGHEIVLQAPMEGYGPEGMSEEMQRRTLSGTDAAQSVDRLRWQMGRYTGYSGVMNFLGARFLASEAAVSPVLKEISARGLYWLDDGSAPQSVSLPAANAAGLPARRADVVLDGSPKSDAVDAALKRLETIAKAKGSAIGVASGLPEVVDRISTYTRNMPEHGVILVPLNTLMAAPGSGLSQR